MSRSSLFLLPGALLSAASTLWAAPIAAPIASSTHPGAIFKNFTNPDDANLVAPYTAPGGVTASVQIVPKDGALQFINRAGGSFGVAFKIDPFDADTLSHIFFDYKLAPDAKINFFFKVNDKYHGVLFSGPSRIRPGSVLLGQIEGVKADGQWHRAHIPLRAWLRELYPTASNLRVDEVIVGNWDNQNYLMAGMGGNGPGATWSLDNFALVGAGPREAKFSIGNSPDYALDNGKKEKASGELNLTASNGLHWLQTFDNAGKMLDSYPFFAAAAPVAGTPVWKENNIVWPLSDGAGLDTRALKATVDGHNYDLSSPFLSYDAATEQLRLAAGDVGLQWASGASVTTNLEGVTDLRGQKTPDTTGKLTLDFVRHEGKPPLPLVQFDGLTTPGVGNFETGKDEWATYGDPGAIVDLDPQNPSSGQMSLRLFNPRSATAFGATIRSSSFDAVQFPILRFDYRVSDRLRVDFRLISNGKNYVIKFTDRDSPKDATVLGTIPNVVTDEKWHQAEIPLSDWLRTVAPTAPNQLVDRLWVQDDAWLGSIRGVQWWVDNFRFVPRFNDGTLKAKVELRDVTGVKGVSWVLDSQPDTIPDERAEPERDINTKGTGRQWLHVRAQNGAGAWSETEHLPVWLGN